MAASKADPRAEAAGGGYFFTTGQDDPTRGMTGISRVSSNPTGRVGSGRVVVSGFSVSHETGLVG